MVHRRGLSPAELAELMGGGGGAQVMAAIAASRLSRHLILIGLVAREADRMPSPVRKMFFEALDQLEDIDAIDRRSTAHLLSYPFVGAWASAALRSLKEIDQKDIAGILSHLGAITAAAAARARQPVDVQVPCQDGNVVIPTLGRLRIDRPEAGPVALRWRADRDGMVDVVGEDFRARIGPDLSVEQQQWTPVREVASEVSGFRWKTLIEDADPYRHSGFIRATPGLTQEQAERWDQRLAQAWQVIGHRHPKWAPAIAEGVRAVVPALPPEVGGAASVTVREAGGAIGASLPVDAVHGAEMLIHELQHTKLDELSRWVDLVGPAEGSVLLYSPWRTTLRRPISLLHAAYAGVSVAEFWQVEGLRVAGSERGAALLESQMARQQVISALLVLNQSGALTPAGLRMVELLEQALGDETPEHGESARRLLAYRRASWRLRQLQLPDQVLEQLAAAWDEQKAHGLAIAARLGPEMPKAPAHPVDRLLRALHEELRGEAPSDPESARLLAQLLTSDASDEVERICRLIHSQETSPPASSGGWALLAALCTTQSTPAHEVLYARPELVQGLSGHLRRRNPQKPTPHPLRLAAWLATPSSGSSLNAGHLGSWIEADIYSGG